jgi:hypothetical protein
MPFRRDGKAASVAARDWQRWLTQNAALIRAAGLPPHVLTSRADWEYLLRTGYHGYPQPDFVLDELSAVQRDAFRRLLETTLTLGERVRGCAGWHFVCPPGLPATGKADPDT